MSTWNNLTGSNIVLQVAGTNYAVLPPGESRFTPEHDVTLGVFIVSAPFTTFHETTVVGSPGVVAGVDRKDWATEFFLGFALIVTASLVAWAIRYTQRAMSNGNADPI